jgi:hypothetical protein
MSEKELKHFLNKNPQVARPCKLTLRSTAAGGAGAAPPLLIARTVFFGMKVFDCGATANAALEPAKRQKRRGIRAIIFLY